MRKRYSITIVYLDLLFALFAALTMVNLVLAISKGRTPHRLEKDFVIVRVEWLPAIREVDDYPRRTRQFALTRVGGGDGPGWVHAQGASPNQSAPARSVFVAPALGAGSWQFGGTGVDADLLRTFAVSVEVQTRGGVRRFEPGRPAAPPIRFETEPSR